MGYRLQGDIVDRLCVKHLAGSERAVVAFNSATRATILLIGPHDESDPSHNIYAELYAVAGVDVPAGPRTKPSCCGEDGTPPNSSDLVDDVVARMQDLSRRRRKD